MASRSIDDDARSAGEHGPPGGPSAAFSNAYAITYRLLGVRSLASGTAAEVAEQYQAMEGSAPAHWLPDLAGDAVVAALRAADSPAMVPDPEPGPGPDSDPDDDQRSDSPPSHPGALDSTGEAGVRRALRRRLRSADARTRVAVGLRHLAGYDTAWVASLMSCPASLVAELCAPFDPPPGVSWDELGDPEAAEARASVVRRQRDRSHRVPVLPIVAVVVVLAFVLWAATSVGPRPSLGTPVADNSRAEFDPVAAPLPSAGCASQDGTGTDGTGPDDPESDSTESGPLGEDRELRVGGVTIGWQISAPLPADVPSSVPAPLLVALPDSGQSAAEFRADSGIEMALPEAVHATVDTDLASGDEPAAAAETVGALIDVVAADQCVDLRRIFVFGFGSGAVAAGDVACTIAEVPAGIAMVGGWREAAGCDAAPEFAALLGINSDDDTLDSDGFDEVGEDWATLLGAESDQTEALSDDTMIHRWEGTGGAPIVTIERPGGGHVWGLGDTINLVDFVDSVARTLG